MKILIFSQINIWAETLKTEVLALVCWGHVPQPGVEQDWPLWGCCSPGSVWLFRVYVGSVMVFKGACLNVDLFKSKNIPDVLRGAIFWVTFLSNWYLWHLQSNMLHNCWKFILIMFSRMYPQQPYLTPVIELRKIFDVLRALSPFLSVFSFFRKGDLVIVFICLTQFINSYTIQGRNGTRFNFISQSLTPWLFSLYERVMCIGDWRWLCSDTAIIVKIVTISNHFKL